MAFHIMKYKNGYRVHDNSAAMKPYSKNPLTKKKAQAQLRALYANLPDSKVFRGSGYCLFDKDIYLDGSGFFGDFFTKIKNVVKGAVNRITGVSQGIRSGYGPKARNVIAKYGDYTITHIYIRRKPIVKMIDTFLNIVSLGKLNEAKAKLGYDKLFHLSMVLQMRPPNTVSGSGGEALVIVEKNEVINIDTITYNNTISQPYMQFGIPSGTSFKELLESAQNAAGPSFFLYDAFTNNCQKFIAGILQSNGLLTEKLKAFILQDTEAILKILPDFIQPLARGATDIAAVANVAIEGQGFRSMNIAELSDVALKGKGYRGGDMRGGSAKSKALRFLGYIGIPAAVGAAILSETDTTGGIAVLGTVASMLITKIIDTIYMRLNSGEITRSDAERELAALERTRIRHETSRQQSEIIMADMEKLEDRKDTISTEEYLVEMTNLQNAYNIANNIAITSVRGLAAQAAAAAQADADAAQADDIVIEMPREIPAPSPSVSAPSPSVSARSPSVSARSSFLPSNIRRAVLSRTATTTNPQIVTMTDNPLYTPNATGNGRALTHRDKFILKYRLDRNHGYSIADISKVTGIKKSILQKVYNRGVGAHKSNPASVRLLDGTKNFSTSLAGKMSKEQWAAGRLFSFVMKGPTYKTTDSDLAKLAGF